MRNRRDSEKEQFFYNNEDESDFEEIDDDAGDEEYDQDGFEADDPDDDSFIQNDDQYTDIEDHENYGRGGKGPVRSRPHRKSHVAQWIILIALIGVFAFSFYKFLSQWLTYQQAVNEYKELDSMISSIPEETEAREAASEETAMQETGDSVEETDSGSSYPRLFIDYNRLLNTNPEFSGVIYIPVLNIRYPIAQAENNSKYLTTTFEGTHNASGCIFLDCTASKDFSDWNTFVFGHNMKNETMFGSLKRFNSESDLCDQNPYIYIYQQNLAGDTVRERAGGETTERTLEEDENRVLIYRIFAYYTIPVNDDVYNDFTGDDGYDAYVQDAQRHSTYKPDGDDIDWTQRPDLLTLSTCYATGHVNNFIVHGALIDIVHE